MKKGILFFLGIVICLLIILLAGRNCIWCSDSVKYSDTVFMTETIAGKIKTDTIPVPYKVEYPIFLKETLIDTVFITMIDTAAIIADYHAKRTYKVPFKDSVAEIEADITVFENKLQEATITYQFQQNNMLITNKEIITPKWNIAIGLGTSYSFKTKTVAININAGVDYKKNRIILGYDPINNSLGIGYQYKIKNF
jgi:hypothetical protein